MKAPQWITHRNEVWSVVEQLADSGEQRARHGNFLVEGTEAVYLAISRKWPVVALLFNSGARLSELSRTVLDSSPAPIFAVAPELMAQLGTRFGTIPEVVAVLTPVRTDLAQLRPSDHFTGVICGPVADPATVGVVIRTAQALGADAVFVDPSSSDPYSPRAVQASGGAMFVLPPIVGYSCEQVLHWANMLGGMTTIAVAANGSAGLAGTTIAARRLLMVADERVGIPAGWLRSADIVLGTPGQGAGLDASALTAMTLPEIQRMADSPGWAASQARFPETDEEDVTNDEAAAEDDYLDVNLYHRFRNR